MKSDFIKCRKCGRQNWRDNTSCAWCLRKMPRHDVVMRRLNIVIAVVSIIAIVTMAKWAVTI